MCVLTKQRVASWKINQETRKRPSAQWGLMGWGEVTYTAALDFRVLRVGYYFVYRNKLQPPRQDQPHQLQEMPTVSVANRPKTSAGNKFKKGLGSSGLKFRKEQINQPITAH